MDEDKDGNPDSEEPDLVTEMDQETAPESFNEAARNERWVQSMKMKHYLFLCMSTTFSLLGRILE